MVGVAKIVHPMKTGSLSNGHAEEAAVRCHCWDHLAALEMVTQTK